MRAIRNLLEQNPELLKFESLDPQIVKKRERYEQLIEDGFDPLEDLARDVQDLIMTMQHWRMEAGERIFEYGKAKTEEYGLNLPEIDRLFNVVLLKWSRGPLLGFFISGTYHEIIGEGDRLFFDLSRYPGAISGFGFKHPKGKIELFGNRPFFLGVKMMGGEVVLAGRAGNHVGKYLQGGHILIRGNAGNWIGHRMHDGLITIEGNAGDIIGKDMSGGEIVIEGDAGGWIGDEMRGGIIRIKGECGLIDGNDSGGEIFTWQKGRWVKCHD